MSQEINAVIDNLCQKLGTSATYLIPEVAKLKTAESATMLVISLMLGLILFKVTPMVWRYDHSSDDVYDERVWIIIPIVLAFITAIIFVISLYDLVGWIASPTAKSIILISNMLK